MQVPAGGHIGKEALDPRISHGVGSHPGLVHIFSAMRPARVRALATNKAHRQNHSVSPRPVPPLLLLFHPRDVRSVLFSSPHLAPSGSSSISTDITCSRPIRAARIGYKMLDDACRHRDWATTSSRLIGLRRAPTAPRTRSVGSAYYQWSEQFPSASSIEV